MNTHALVRPLPGPGLVARYGDLLLVCGEGPDADRLMDLIAEVAGTGGDGSMLVRRAAALIAADFDGRVPDCALSGPVAGGDLAVLVYGAATATVAARDGDVSLAGADAIASVNRMVPGPISAVRLELPGAGTAHPRARLADGAVVPGAGVAASADSDAPEPESVPVAPGPQVSADPEPSEPPAPVEPPRTVPEPQAPEQYVPEQPEPQAPEQYVPEQYVPESAAVERPEAPVAVEFVAVPQPAEPVAADAAVEPVAAQWAPAPAPVEAAPVESAPVEPAPAEPPAEQPFVAVLLAPGAETSGEAGIPAAPALDARPMVSGVHCPNDHFIDPASPACPYCGASMAYQTLVVREGPRPSLGVLLLDDGSAYQLDSDYVIGREPQHDPDVLAGAARPLKVSDAEGVVSRRHLRLALVGWEVQVVDLGSANGTFVDLPGDPQRRQAAPHDPIAVTPGSLITIGRRWLRYETNAAPVM